MKVSSENLKKSIEFFTKKSIDFDVSSPSALHDQSVAAPRELEIIELVGAEVEDIEAAPVIAYKESWE